MPAGPFLDHTWTFEREMTVSAIVVPREVKFVDTVLEHPLTTALTIAKATQMTVGLAGVEMPVTAEAKLTKEGTAASVTKPSVATSAPSTTAGVPLEEQACQSTNAPLFDKRRVNVSMAPGIMKDPCVGPMILCTPVSTRTQALVLPEMRLYSSSD